MPDCIFCRIIAGQIPCAKLAETDNVISFMDIAPVNHGHCLVIPKRHVENLLELTEAELHDCIVTAQRVAKATVAATGAVGFNILQNNHPCAGQVVPHMHMHVIPRSPSDGFRFGWRQGRYSEGEMQALQQRILAQM